MDPFYFFGPDDQLLDAAAVDDLTSLGLVLSPAPPPPAAAALPAGSAFEAYRRRVPEYSSLTMSRRRYNSEEQNLHRRMFSYLRRIAHDAGAVAPPAFPAPADETTATVGVGSSSSSSSLAPPQSSRFRHIMRERLRRERLSQGFADLHALLPPGASSRGGKNDIVGAAAGYIRELAARKEWLSARNEVLLQRESAATTTCWRGGDRSSCGGGRRGMVVKVRAESQDHSMAVDAFERVLRRLKAMKDQLQVTAIRSRFSAGGSMWMNIGVEGQVSTREVDKAITNALMELEGNDPRNKPSFSCQVESGQMG